MRFVFTFVREKVKFVREKSGKCQGISRGTVCGNHELELIMRHIGLLTLSEAKIKD